VVFVANFHGDKSAALVEYLAEQGVVVMQGRDRGSGRVESVLQLGAFACFVGEFCSQGGDFVGLRASPGVNPSHAATRVFHWASIGAARFMVARLKPASFQRRP
jgi:hypothetical protein